MTRKNSRPGRPSVSQQGAVIAQSGKKVHFIKGRPAVIINVVRLSSFRTDHQAVDCVTIKVFLRRVYVDGRIMLQQACSYSHTAGSCSLSSGSGGGGAPPRVHRSGIPPRLPSIVTVSEDTPDDSIWVISPVTNSLYPAPNFSTSGTVFTLISFFLVRVPCVLQKREHTRIIQFIC